MQGQIRVYADTSVYGGLFDEEFSDASCVFFDRARNGYFRLVTSDIVSEEIESAPPNVRRLFEEMSDLADLVQVNEEVLTLRSAYLKAGIVGARSLADALHVAAATVFGCRAIVSWNFHHIVHWQKIPLYNGINQAMGFPPIAIHTPQEVISDDEEDL